MQNTKPTLEREKTSGMQMLGKARLNGFVDGCDMEWYTCLCDILQKKRIIQNKNKTKTTKTNTNKTL